MVAVWLNEHPEKIVVAPKNWSNDPRFDTKDIYLQNWVKL